ncbi:MAG: FdtA/QdtA family cupin domain-containing protein [Bdellovibrionota bacterium]
MAKIVNLKSIEDKRGTLVIAQDEIPFSIARVFFIYGTSEMRGGHRHIRNRMGLIAQQGSVEVFCQNSTTESLHTLSNPSQCLLVDPEDWHTMKFSKNAVLLVLSSEKYDEEDYITDRYR